MDYVAADQTYRKGVMMKISRGFLAMLVTVGLSAGLAAMFSGCETLSALSGLQAGGLTTEKIVAGLREALRVGTDQTVARTSRAGGYAKNPLIRIPTPEALQEMASTLRRIGLGSQVDEFESRMNLAAEQAATEAGGVFLDAIGKMTFADAKGILDGGDTAATEFFRTQTSATLRARYQPIIAANMEKVGAVGLYNDLVGRYNRITLVPKVEANIEGYVADKALAGLFTVLGEEEKKIRRDPAARTTELLRQVFGK
jgi:hypothetical protein